MDNIDEAKDELKRILNEQEYTNYIDQPSNIFSIWWEKAKNWLADQLAELLPSFEKTSMLAEPILIIIIVAVLSFIAIVLFSVVRNRRQKWKLRETTPLQSMKEIDWSYQMHLTEAMKQEDSEKFSTATRHLFLALLLYFHEKEWLEARYWKTNWEYYEELKKVNQQSANQFHQLAFFFDEATYGERDVQKEEYFLFQKVVMTYLREKDE